MDIQQALTEAVEAALPAPTPTPAPEPAPQDPEETQDPVETTDETTEVATEEATEDDSEAKPEESEPEIALPEGYVAVPVVEDGLATEFTLKDADGEVEIPALIVEYKANGKMRQDRLDQVVKLAQFGVYNEAREQQFKQAEQQAQQLQQERDEYARLIDEREAQLERILTDEDFFLAVREAFAEENSPERRVARAEARAEQARVQAQMQPVLMHGQAFYEREVAPALDLIAQTFPTLTPDELSNRMAYAMQLHVERAPNGVSYIPPSQYDAVRQYIMDDLAVWAQVTHARRSPVATAPAQEAALQDELAKAQVSAQKAKRAVGQATKPVGRAASNTPAKPKAAKPATVDDALDSAMSEILASIR